MIAPRPRRLYLSAEQVRRLRMRPDIDTERLDAMIAQGRIEGVAMRGMITVEARVMLAKEYDRDIADAKRRGAAEAVRALADGWYEDGGGWDKALSTQAWLHARAEAIDPHVHDTGNFDRTLCPEPCGAMHSYCSTCGVRQDPCAFEASDEGWTP